MYIRECLMSEIESMIQEYVHTLSSPFDAFYEEHILDSKFYVIELESRQIGYYAIHNEQLLTQFYIKSAYMKHAQQLFGQVIEHDAMKQVFVPTCDELFLSLAVDQESLSLNKQAYFFQDSHVSITENASTDVEFKLATEQDVQEIKRMCGDFLGDQYEMMQKKEELFTYVRGSVLLGIGVVQRSVMLYGFASIGMFTHEEYRRQGIGLDIILKLKSWSYDNQLKPICGCWYYNHNSKRTLESAGMVTRTRLLRFDKTSR